MKFFWLIFLCVLTITCIDGKKGKGKDKTRLYGSQNGVDGQFPYAVFHILKTPRGHTTCSGSIIEARWVLTAAHCINKDSNPRNHLVVAGKADLNPYVRARFRSGMSFQRDINEATFDLQERRADGVYPHPQHSKGGNNDVGLLRLSRPFVLNDRVALIPLSREAFGERSDCTLIGFGVVENNARKYITQFITGMPAKPARLCRYQRFRDVICLGDRTRGVCHGDSGGPLVCGAEQRGVASHGISNEQGCGRGTVEQYYTDTQRNLEWIEETRINNSRR